MGIEAETPELWHLLCLHSYALTTELTWQIEGDLTFPVLVQFTFGLR